MKKILSVLLVAVLIISFSAFAWADNISSSTVNRYNVMLVVDGSDSLIHMEKSDPKGFRYDALKLFLGLLTENGNNAGAIVFDDTIMLETKISTMSNMSNKLNLAKNIQKAGTGGYTNIGKAMQLAVEDLEEVSKQNNLPCIILLLTDGNTSLRPGTGQPALDNAYKAGEEAIERAVEDDIKIYGIWLNASGEGDASEILQYTSSTGGQYQEVRDSENLADAFRQFYTIINNTEYSDAQKTEFDSSGKAEKTFTVPNFGVEEVNIVVDINEPLRDIEVTKPDGSSLKKSEIDNISMITSRYQLIKIPNPGTGLWSIKLTGEPGSSVDVSMLYNYSIRAALSSNNDSSNYQHAIPYTFTCKVSDEKMPVITDDNLKSLNANLVVTNSVTQEVVSVPMEVENGQYVLDYSFDMGSYYIYASVGTEGFAYKTNQLLANVGNLPPVVSENIVETVKTGVGKDGIFTVNLLDYISDPEGGNLKFEIDNNYNGKVSIEDGVLSVDCNDIDHAFFKINATDNMGASSEMEVDLTEKNITTRTIILSATALLLLIAAIAAFFIWKNNLKCRLNYTIDFFSPDDWESLNPIYDFHGRKYLKGSMPGYKASDYWLEATKDKYTCLFRSKKKFYSEGGETNKIELRKGVSAKIYLDADRTCGLEIESQDGEF